MAEPHALRSESEGVLTLTLNRPSKLNALSGEILDALRVAAADLGAREDLRVLLIDANGKYFSSGMDVARMDRNNPESSSSAGTAVGFRRSYRELHALFDELEAVEKPVVVAHQGPCLGGALEMSLSCDFRLAAQSASYGFPEMALAVLPGSGGTSRLTRLVGPGWARWLVMADRHVDAQRALTMGLVHEVYPDEVFAQEVQRFARELAALPGEVVGLAKLTIEACADLDRGTGRNVERIANSLLVRSPDHQRAVERFLARSAGRAGT